MITRNIDSIIERRLLVSYRIDPELVDALLPPPFRPQLVNGHAVGGVCFIRMRALRPAPLPRAAGVTTENVAHWFAIEWHDKQGSHSGVFIPRRDTSTICAAPVLPGWPMPGSRSTFFAKSPDTARWSPRSATCSRMASRSRMRAPRSART